MSENQKYRRTRSGFLFSFCVHAAVLIGLSMIYLPNPLELVKEIIAQPGILGPSDEIDIFDDPELGDVPLKLEEPAGVAALKSSSETFEISSLSETLSNEIVEPDFSKNAFASSNVETAFSKSNALSAHAFDGRGKLKGQLLAEGGGSEGSEKAVALGLRWLAEHQSPNGSWSYDFAKCPNCQGQCGNPAQNPSRNSATAFALLPFLGSGITHQQGQKEYRAVVDKGLKFLLKNATSRPEGLSFIDVEDEGKYGGMYHQGITAILICEAAAMSHDSKLKAAAQKAIDFICFAQTKDGGWRYRPRDASGGDTSVLGWQVLALQSARMGDAAVPAETLYGTKRFLDTVVALDDGSLYGYRKNRPSDGSRATTAIGLLSQMFLGWRSENPALARGVRYLSEWGPDPGNLYYNYYATQVLHHYGGEPWETWNRQQRDSLVERQVLRGHERGSWFFDGAWNDSGGRLYTTAMALLILEVYYRHLPLYKNQPTDQPFPLD